MRLLLSQLASPHAWITVAAGIIFAPFFWSAIEYGHSTIISVRCSEGEQLSLAKEAKMLGDRYNSNADFESADRQWSRARMILEELAACGSVAASEILFRANCAGALGLRPSLDSALKYIAPAKRLKQRLLIAHLRCG